MRRDAFLVADVVLRARRDPAMHARQHRRRGDAEHAAEVARRRFRRARSSDSATASGSCAPPRNARSSTISSGARPVHFDDTHVQAVMRSAL